MKIIVKKDSTGESELTCYIPETAEDSALIALLLRKCSWQRIVQLLREKDVLPWLTENLELKYGL